LHKPLGNPRLVQNFDRRNGISGQAHRSVSGGVGVNDHGATGAGDGYSRAVVCPSITVNLEKMRIVKLVPKLAFYNPKCPQCGKRMKSMGKGKGFRCEKCGFRSSRLNKITVESHRDLEVGLYITSPRSQRHLTKPHSRYGREKSQAPHKMIQGWHFP